MTAESFAELVNARRTGAGKWQARCPAHDDRSPSLSIAEGHSGILLRCWSHGCTAEQIVMALGLSMRDLFDATLTPGQRLQAAQAKAMHDAEQARQRAADREQRDRIYKLERLMDAIGAKLARNPDDRELGKLFHQVCERWHELETELYPVAPELGELRMEAPAAIPGWIADALVELGRNFGEGKGPLDAGLERIA